MEKVIIYTDGACSFNPGPGGWGAVLIYKDKELKTKFIGFKSKEEINELINNI